MRQLLFEAMAESSDRASLRKQLGTLLSQRNFESLQLESAYLAAISHFLGFSFPLPSIHQLPNGLPLEEWAGHLHGRQVPRLLSAIELGILWALLGAVHQRDDYRAASLKIAHWLLNLLDGESRLMAGIWMPPDDFSEQKLGASWDFLLQLASAMSGDVRFKRSRAAFTDPWIESLRAYLLPKVEARAKFPLSPILEEMTVGMMSYHAKEWNGIFSLSGYGSGLGAIHRKSAKIVTIGPQKAPFDDFSTFGIFRRPPFKEMGWEKGGTGALLQGWTQAADMWMQMAAACGPEEVHLGVRCDVLKENFYMVFYVQGAALTVNGAKTLTKGELHCYRGPATEIVVQGDKEKIRIEPREETYVEIIPLAGGDFFYGSDFLIAFPWRKDQSPVENKFLIFTQIAKIGLYLYNLGVI